MAHSEAVALGALNPWGSESWGSKSWVPSLGAPNYLATALVSSGMI